MKCRFLVTTAVEALAAAGVRPHQMGPSMNNMPEMTGMREA